MAKILIVDDSTFQRRILSSLVTRIGHDVIEAENGEVGLRVAAENPDLDAILMDLSMPVLDGFGMLEGLESAGCAAPRIVITADIQERTRERCLALGALAVVKKPFGEESLRDVISLLGQWSAARP